jgi:ribosomal protein S18 acetylase RimI-like enzyme
MNLFTITVCGEVISQLSSTDDMRFVPPQLLGPERSDIERRYIYNVSTHPDYRGKGLMKILLQDFFALRWEPTIYYLLVKIEKFSVIALYRLFNFEIVGIHMIDGDESLYWVMRKEVS